MKLNAQLVFFLNIFQVGFFFLSDQAITSQKDYVSVNTFGDNYFVFSFSVSVKRNIFYAGITAKRSSLL